MKSQSAGVALLRLAAFAVAAIAVGLVLATFGVGAATADEDAGLQTVQVAVLFFGPIAALLTLAFIVVLALTRPVSMQMPARRQAARVVAIAYLALAILASVVLSTLAWAVIAGVGAAISSVGAWWLLREPSAHAG